MSDVLGPEYFQAGENRMEIFPRGGFYMPSNIWNLIYLTHAPEYSNWKSFVRDVLIQVYENKLPNYTAKGKRSRPSIDGKLLKALFKKINEPRSCQEQVPEHKFQKRSESPESGSSEKAPNGSKMEIFGPFRTFSELLFNI
ncbi:hypothetical protein PV326_008423, partial [Microctonus aethiopoides]